MRILLLVLLLSVVTLSLAQAWSGEHVDQEGSIITNKKRKRSIYLPANHRNQAVIHRNNYYIDAGPSNDYDVDINPSWTNGPSPVQFVINKRKKRPRKPFASTWPMYDEPGIHIQNIYETPDVPPPWTWNTGGSRPFWNQNDWLPKKVAGNRKKKHSRPTPYDRIDYNDNIFVNHYEYMDYGVRYLPNRHTLNKKLRGKKKQKPKYQKKTTYKVKGSLGITFDKEKHEDEDEDMLRSQPNNNSAKKLRFRFPRLPRPKPRPKPKPKPKPPRDYDVIPAGPENEDESLLLQIYPPNNYIQTLKKWKHRTHRKLRPHKTIAPSIGTYDYPIKSEDIWV